MILVAILILSWVASTSMAKSQRLRLLAPDRTGITFTNMIVESDTFNVLADFYAYNGGGVGSADFDGDGLLDVVFSGTHSGLTLYHNKGAMQFEDATRASGLYSEQDGSVYSGVLVADLSGDGYPDIYVSRRYHPNKLFVNNGRGEFTEQSAQRGLAIQAFSTQALALDYDRDGDLDVYLVNSGEPRRQGYVNPGVCDMLLRNDGSGVFTDVSKQAGISDKGYGLSASMGDLNNDGWPDIFVANDFEARDIIYANNGDGTFRDTSVKAMANMSWASMGSDIADLNADGMLDIISMDMLPRDNWRRQTQIGGMSIYGPFFDSLQRVHNALQLNRGQLRFSNVCYLANVAATDWSWAVLATDIDMDGLNDLLITNGTKRDLGDQDYAYNLFAGNRELRPDAYKMMPQSKIAGYAFRGTNLLRFDDVTADWGFNQSAVGNGAIYADLDNDGDLDVVVNNTDTIAFVYQNTTITNRQGPRWIGFELYASTANPTAIGARVTAHGRTRTIIREVSSSRGFLSTPTSRIVIPIDAIGGLDSITIRWPNGFVSTHRPTSANQYEKIVLPADAAEASVQKTPRAILTDQVPSSIPFHHRENSYDDFKRERLLPNRFSKDGPGIAVGDVNGDGLQDVVLTGAKYMPTQCFLRAADGSFSASSCGIDDVPDAEDVDAALVDVDGDRDLDLIVATGGNEFDEGDQELEDRLYLNNGKGQFRRVANAFSARTSSARIAVGDFDGDGDPDLFIGGRVTPGKFPLIPRSVLYRNNKGVFADVTDAIAPTLSSVGHTTQAVWTDIDSDKDLDLVIVGEWMSPKVYRNTNGSFSDVSSSMKLDSYTGLWNCVRAADINGDGRTDLIVGNVGLNCRFVPSMSAPITIYSADFDDNGSLDPLVTYSEGGNRFLTRGRMTITQHMPTLTRKYTTYASFAAARIQDVLSPEALASAQTLNVTTYASTIFYNMGSEFRAEPLPDLAQISPVMDIVVRDLDANGTPDLIIAGNTHTADGDVVGYDAGLGLVLMNRGKGLLDPLSIDESGLLVPNEVRRMAVIGGKGMPDLLCCTINGRRPRLFGLPPVTKIGGSSR